MVACTIIRAQHHSNKASFDFALGVERGGTPWRPTGELARSFECLPAKLTFLAVGDHRDSAVPGLIAGLPAIVQMMSTSLAGAAGLGATAPSDLLTLAGIPGAGQFRLRIDPGKVPREEDLRSHLFPSLLAATVDDRGIRFLLREAFPMAACTGNGTSLKSSIKWSGGKGWERTLKVGLKWPFGG